MNELKLGVLAKSARQNTFAEKAEMLAHAATGSDASERKRAAQEFASFLYLEVLKAMRATIPKAGLFEDNSLSRDVYSSMFDTEVARVLAKRDSEGFTSTVERSIEKIAPKPRDGAAVNVPVAGAVSSTFGMRLDPIIKKESFHAGIDIAAPMGTEIKAASGGKIIFSGTSTGYGKMVEIDHGGGMVTRYAHNAANLVSVGQEIRVGESIAIVGSTGRATGAHLHFEVRQDGKPVDPAPFIGAVGRGRKLNAIV